MEENGYRAWDESSKEMIYFEDGMYGAEWDSAMMNGYLLLQFICRKDKDGKKIYEEDIVKGKLPMPDHTYNEICGILNFHNGSFLVGHIPIASLKDPKVIGNIRENPEISEKYGLKEGSEE